MSKQKRVTIPIPHEVLRRSESMEDAKPRDLIGDLTKRIEGLEKIVNERFAELANDSGKIMEKMLERIEYLEMVVDKHIDFECNCCGKVIKREQGHDYENQFLCNRCYEDEGGD